MTWQEQAACRTAGVDVDLFFPVEENGSSIRQIEQAKRICRRCPVPPECRRLALDTHERFGVWGGMSARERITVLRTRARSAAVARG